MKAPLTAIILSVASIVLATEPPEYRMTAGALIRFVRSDFRRVFCDHETLRSRIERRVAVIARLGASHEFPLGERETVASLMEKGGLKFQKGSSHLQFRLVAKDAIYQSPDTPDKSLKDAFATREVQPGDILFTTVVD